MLKSKIGVEAEFLLLNDKDEAIVPPETWDRDGFPLLGEIRGDPGKNVSETVSNFLKKKMEIEADVKEAHKLVMLDIMNIGLATYRKAMKQVTETKGVQIGLVKNIYGRNIEDYSDQVISTENHKIQGINASCGLHIHFSCEKLVTKTVKDTKYESVILPIKIAEVSGENTILTEMISPVVQLYRKIYLPHEEQVKISAHASIITKPVINYIVKEMDKHFFDKFAPEKNNRTKYRQPGFYELKPYGFEYRSLPANEETIKFLPEIVGKAFELINSL